MKCKVGDLAVVVRAYNASNVGLVVKVLAVDDGSHELSSRSSGPTWLVECATSMTWELGGSLLVRNQGPVPDSCLEPIRGIFAPEQVATDVGKRIPQRKVSEDEELLVI